MRSLARSLILHEKIQTTEAKAKEMRPYVEKMITRSKIDTLPNRRLIDKEFNGMPQITRKLFTIIGPRYQNRPGGYTRITKLATFSEDNRKIAQIEFV